MDNLLSSQVTTASPSSCTPQYSSPQQPPTSSQGFSVTQSMPNGLSPLSMVERPPSCGQDPNNIPTSGQRSGPSSDTFSHYNTNGMHQPQSENRMPSTPQGFRSDSQSSQLRDDRDDLMNDLTNATCSPNVQSMEDWEKANPYTGRPKLVPTTVPRSTGEWKIKLQHKCDRDGVRPEFVYTQPSEQAFIAILSVHGKTFETPTPQPSKKLAQEEVCKVAVAGMPPMEQMQGLEGTANRGKKRKSGDIDLEQPVRPQADKSEDWISLLNTHSQQTKSHPPMYEDSHVEGDPQRFVSKLSIGDRLNEPFMVNTEGFRSKKDARSAVAKVAVMWLRKEGVMTHSANRYKRRTSSQASITGTGLTGIMQFTPKEKSLPEQLHRLVQELGLKSPKWLLSKSTLPSSEPIDSNLTLYDMHAEFDERDTIMEPGLRGRKGEVKHCHGQKKAKEECCRRVVPLLEVIKAKRLASL